MCSARRVALDRRDDDVFGFRIRGRLTGEEGGDWHPATAVPRRFHRGDVPFAVVVAVADDEVTANAGFGLPAGVQ